MQERFLQFIAEKKLCTRSNKILLAVSGGMDSMVMLELFHRTNFSVAVAHVNFQLRDNDSELDESLVEETCKKHSIPFFTKRFDTSAYAQKHSLSIQMAARALRYEWFNELVDQNKFDFIATAHHLNDSIETALLNFTRGSGLEGWDGIAAKNEKIVRPLLFATRSEIEAYANENKINWREDRSNSSDDYQRNFIRHHVVPRLKEINLSLENSFADALEKISASNELSWLGIESFRNEFESKKADQILFSKKAFAEFRHPEGLLWNLIKGYGFNLDQCKQIILALPGQSGKKFLSKEFEVIIDREQLIISKTKAGVDQVLIDKDQQRVERGGQVLEMSVVNSFELLNDNSVAFLDLSKLKFPLVWR
ncbi:MAG TPA: tRNA lysidine(34) synthetase TilS, partial [Cytophagales bacterium]|nr:tRNA lysidine(34) synthetase TilS [Cytophagales bacterium]